MTGLEILVADGEERLEILRSGTTVIGRGLECEISLPQAPHLSKRHLEFTQRDGSLQARDLGSKNGTTRNGVPLVGVIDVRDGDCLVLGRSVRLMVRFDASEVVDETITLLPEGARDDAPHPNGAREGARALLDVSTAPLPGSVGAQAWALGQLSTLVSAPTEGERLRRLVHLMEPIVRVPVFAVAWDVGVDETPRVKHLVSTGPLPTGALPRPPIHPGWTDRWMRPERSETRWVTVGPRLVVGIRTATLSQAAKEPIDAISALYQMAFLAAPRPIPDPEPLPGQVGWSIAHRDVCAQVRAWADQPHCVLFVGEPGTCLGEVARAMHAISCHPSRFVEVSALEPPPPISGTETWFVDHVEAITPDAARAWLDVLRPEARFAGRVLAAHYGLDPTALYPEPIRALLDVLAFVQIRIPPLRERGRDLGLLVQDAFETATRPLGNGGPHTVSAEVREALIHRDYPRNLEELRAVVHRAVHAAHRQGASTLELPHLLANEPD